MPIHPPTQPPTHSLTAPTRYNSMLHALRTIPQQEGFLRLYRGMGATVTGRLVVVSVGSGVGW